MKNIALFALLLSFSPLLKAAPNTATPVSGWYDIQWMLTAPHAPTIRVLDTESSLGPYAVQTKTITLRDLVQLHGHPCDGLVLAASALHFGFPALYPNGIVDRTDTGIITNNSPCFGDVGAYLTGGRIRFGTQKVDPTMKNEFIVCRFSTGKAVKISLKPGVFPESLTRMEAIIRHGNATLAEVRHCQQLQLQWIRTLLYTVPGQLFEVRELRDFHWIPDSYGHMGKRGDTRIKSISKNPADIRLKMEAKLETKGFRMQKHPHKIKSQRRTQNDESENSRHRMPKMYETGRTDPPGSG